jgi:hypothetical protein
MKLMKFLLLLSVTILSHFLATAQNFKILSQLPVNENAYISALKIKRDEYGIGLLTNKGAMTKEQTINSVPNGLAILGDDVILIGASEKNYKTTGYNATLFNKKSLAVLKEKSLYSKEGSNRISSTLLKDPDNNFCYVLFRETKFDEGFKFMGPSMFDTKYLESSSIKLASLNNNLEPKNIIIKTEALDSYFAGACADDKRNIYICSFTKTAMLMEKFDSTGKLIGKLSSPFSVWKNPDFNFLMKNDRDDQGCITITSSCLNENKQKAHHVIRFDFTNNRILATGEIILNKDYLKALKNTNAAAKGSHFAFPEGMVPIQILEDAGRVIVVKEIMDEREGSKGDATTYYRDGSIITIYNKKTFTVDRDIVIDKGFATFVEPSEGIYTRLLDNYLWIITCENSGLTSFKTYVSKVNLTTGEVVKTEIKKEDIGKGTVTFPKQTAWFKKEFVVPFLKVVSPFSMSFETEFKVIPY